MTLGLNIKKNIVYEDTSIIIFDKPQGIATALGKKDNLCEIVFCFFPELKEVKGYKKNEGGLLNRLDNETGGLVLFAKSNDAFLYYSQKMKNLGIDKIYTAVVDGKMSNSSGFINYPIAHHYKNKSKMIAVKKNELYRGKPRNAVTEWKLIKVVDDKSILEVKIKKGARHQIRVHLASIGFPIVGDKLYNEKKNKSSYKNHLLYASGLNFTSCADMKDKNIVAGVPFFL